jgi:hypothetical protein
MFATKTRTTIIALIASSSFAVSTIAPSISQAQKVQTAPHKITKEEACSAFGELESKANQEAAKYLEEGDLDSAETASATAELIFQTGVREGCWPAAMAVSITSHPISVLGSGSGVLPHK